MNTFDAAICIVALVAIVGGFHSGLLRSIATIVGYLAALPATAMIAPYLPFATGRLNMAEPQSMLPLFGIFFVIGLVLSALLRLAVSEAVGPTVSLPDRAAGAALGAVRVGLLAVLLVVIFDRMIPPKLEPPFLKESRLRPILSVAGQNGLKTLPPEAALYIDRLKKERGI